MNTSFRIATVDDVFELMRLHQLDSAEPARDGIMVDHNKLARALEDPRDLWVVGHDKSGRIHCSASAMLDLEQALCKIHRLCADPHLDGPDLRARSLVSFLIETLTARGDIEVVYTTTWKMSQRAIDLTQEIGFRLLGIFPNVISADTSRLNAIAALYLGDVLEQRRMDVPEVHPSVWPFAKLVFDQWPEHPGRQPAPAAQSPLPEITEVMPPLEIIDAPLFVNRRYHELKSRHFFDVAFYPFQTPNAVLTSPSQDTEVFVRTIPALRFAMILGERVSGAIDPVELYRQVAQQLSRRGITYVETIADASDLIAAECLASAGYLPSVYFPGLKRHGKGRRDYVVFGRSMERTLVPPQARSKQLKRFWGAYCENERALLT
ncbi:MAG: hypothetical protein AAFQ82_01795 [Myxococcota bacterium]